MRVELWLELTCPWCGLGSHVLDKALARIGGERVDVVRRSLMLDSGVPAGITRPVIEVLRSKHGLTDDQARESTGMLERLAEGEGLKPYRVLDNRVGSTLLAHALAAWATEMGRGSDMWRALYRAHWAEARSIFELRSLVAIADEEGFDAEAARDALSSRRYEWKVRADGEEARKLGITSVPFLVIDRRYAVPDMRSADAVAAALSSARREGSRRGGGRCGT